MSAGELFNPIFPDRRCRHAARRALDAWDPPALAQTEAGRAEIRALVEKVKRERPWIICDGGPQEVHRVVNKRRLGGY